MEMKQPIDLSSSTCFAKLPTFIQESIRQNGVNFYSEQEIVQCAQNILDQI